MTDLNPEHQVCVCCVSLNTFSSRTGSEPRASGLVFVVFLWTRSAPEPDLNPEHQVWCLLCFSEHVQLQNRIWTQSIRSGVCCVSLNTFSSRTGSEPRASGLCLLCFSEHVQLQNRIWTQSIRSVFVVFLWTRSAPEPDLNPEHQVCVCCVSLNTFSSRTGSEPRASGLCLLCFSEHVQLQNRIWTQSIRSGVCCVSLNTFSSRTGSEPRASGLCLLCFSEHVQLQNRIWTQSIRSGVRCVSLNTFSSRTGSEPRASGLCLLCFSEHVQLQNRIWTQSIRSVFVVFLWTRSAPEPDLNPEHQVCVCCVSLNTFSSRTGSEPRASGLCLLCFSEHVQLQNRIWTQSIRSGVRCVSLNTFSSRTGSEPRASGLCLLCFSEHVQLQNRIWTQSIRSVFVVFLWTRSAPEPDLNPEHQVCVRCVPLNTFSSRTQTLRSSQASTKDPAQAHRLFASCFRVSRVS